MNHMSVGRARRCAPRAAAAATGRRGRRVDSKARAGLSAARCSNIRNTRQFSANTNHVYKPNPWLHQCRKLETFDVYVPILLWIATGDAMPTCSPRGHQPHCFVLCIHIYQNKTTAHADSFESSARVHLSTSTIPYSLATLSRHHVCLSLEDLRIAQTYLYFVLSGN